MREITEHQINALNKALHIEADERDEVLSGSYHYSVTVHEDGKPVRSVAQIDFQHGEVSEVGVIGLSNEVLLAIVIDRLRGWQFGPWACRENAIALTKLEEGLMWLQARTRDRIARGVEDTYRK